MSKTSGSENGVKMATETYKLLSDLSGKLVTTINYHVSLATLVTKPSRIVIKTQRFDTPV
jgi:hypothetical protein